MVQTGSAPLFQALSYPGQVRGEGFDEQIPGSMKLCTGEWVGPF